ncbi:MAG: GTP pyrophosphokinase [Candidatus Omnitrophica bacterium]|nr:GTP pyrophosphokinase [Candidatus Omnitrophota bacterium]
MSDLQRAIEIAVEAHKDQTRRNGSPYILHPLRVMVSMQNELQQMVAVLHDVVEDSPWTIEQLRAEGFSEAVLDAVAALTKSADDDYQEYLQRVRSNPVARAVKLADLRDNMNVPELPEVTDSDRQRLEKYRAAFILLQDGLG